MTDVKVGDLLAGHARQHARASSTSSLELSVDTVYSELRSMEGQSCHVQVHIVPLECSVLYCTALIYTKYIMLSYVPLHAFWITIFLCLPACLPVCLSVCSAYPPSHVLCSMYVLLLVPACACHPCARVLHPLSFPPDLERSCH